MLEAIRNRIHRLQDNMSLVQQISLATALVSLIGIGALAFSSAGLSRTEMINRIRQDTAGLAHTFAQQLDTDMAERFSDVKQLATMAPLSALWDTDPASVRTLLDQLQATLSYYAWIGFVRPDGVVAAASGGLLVDASVAGQPWFESGLRGPFVGDVHDAVLLARILREPVSGGPMRFVDLAYPVHGKDGQLLGVLGAHLAFDWAEALRQAALEQQPNKDIWVLSKEGTILLGPKMPGPLFAAERVAAMSREKAGTFEDVRGGREFLIGFAVADGVRNTPGLGWIVVARQDASVAFEIPTRVGATILALGVVVLFASLFVSAYVAGRISRPLTDLTYAAGEIGRDPQTTMLPRLRGASEVIALSGALRALMRRLGSAELRFTQHAQQYNEDIAALRQLADSDPLTGLLNRRSFLSVAETALQGTRSSDSLGILMADIDLFKRVNDTYGHAAGDAVIRHVGACMSAALRGQDRVARFGGEEFVALLLDISEAELLALAERMRASISNTTVPFEGHDIQVTVSFGAALARRGDRDVDAVIERADLALYEAKTTGRNRVALSGGMERAA